MKQNAARRSTSAARGIIGEEAAALLPDQHYYAHPVGPEIA
jgi:hypothetical protein